MVEEQCQQEPLLESLDIGATVCQWEKNSPMLAEEGSGKEAGEEPQNLILHSIPINLDPSTTGQPKNNPLPIHILPTLHGTTNGSGACSDMEHLDLGIFASSTSSSSLQRLERLVWGSIVSPTFCFYSFYFILFYFDFFYFSL